MSDITPEMEVLNEVGGGKVRVSTGPHPTGDRPRIVTLRVPGSVWPGRLSPDEAEAIARALNAVASAARALDQEDQK